MKIADGVSEFNRKRKYDIFVNKMYFDQNTRILDVGFNNIEYSSVDNFLEKNYPYQQNIVALGIDKSDLFEKRYPKARAVIYDGNVFPFEDQEFDVCWSNAVIEHVGKFDDQLNFIKEINRVSRKAFITTPNRYFPFEVHTRTPLVHFLPKGIFEKYLKSVHKNWATGNYMNLLSIYSLKKLLKLAGIREYTIIRNKIMFFTLDFVIIF